MRNAKPLPHAKEVKMRRHCSLYFTVYETEILWRKRKKDWKERRTVGQKGKRKREESKRDISTV